MSDTEYTPTDETVRYAFTMHIDGIYEDGDELFDRWLTKHDAELTKRVRAEQREKIIIEVMMIPCWANEGRSEFDIPGESHRDTVLAAIREASDD